jgi:hypothetical protein
MKIFWHSSSLIFDVSTYARLALCFEDIVVPDDDPGLYFPHSDLKKRIGYGAIDAVPGIVAGQLKGNNLSLLSSALQGLLDVLAPNLARSIRARSALKSTFGLAYLYRLGKISEKGGKEK